MDSQFQIVEVSALNSEDLEQLGTKPKYWYRDGNRRMMFKAENRQTGEDWAERLVCEFCKRLGIPHVHYELAFDTHQKLPGVICENIAAKPTSLILGNQLMLDIDPSYPSAAERRYHVSEHTVPLVRDAVSRLSLPNLTDELQPLPPKVGSAFGVFVGYVMLDALVANQDRHHQNWGAVRGTETRLAPTFDHGASLARNEPDPKRQRRLDAGDSERQMSAYADRARSAFYADRSDTRTLTTHAAFERFADFDEAAAVGWLSRLQQLSVEEIESIIQRVPDSRMTDTARRFTLKLVELNRTRLLNTIASDDRS